MKSRRLSNYWKRFKRLSIRKKALLVCGVLLIFLIFIPVATYAYFSRDISDPERLMNRKSTGIVLLDQKGAPFYSFGRSTYQNDITLSEISDNLEKAAIASEDQEFYNHSGVSIKGVGAAFYANILNKDLTKYGGSTLTQQLVKNTLLTSEKDFLRKYQEISMAIAVDRRYSKNEILQMYLNSVYFGEGAFGIGPAAKTYFNKSPKDLTLAESSMLIGLLPAPSTYSPISGDKELAKKQQTRVLSLMVEAGFIDNEQKQQTLAQELAYATTAEEQKNAAHFSLMVLDELKKRYGEEKATRSGYVVTTTLNMDWQKQAEDQVVRRVSQLKNQGGNNAALVAIDPKNGEIRALVGSANWDDPTFGKVNMALAKRQPGSSFKPIFYTEAMEKRLITPATILTDSPKTYGTYAPQNYDFKFFGKMTARRALAQSRNIPAIEVMEKLGPTDASEAAQRMGISSVNEPSKYGLSLALGTAEAPLLSMTNAYATFANAGKQSQTTTIVSIKDKFEKTIYEHEADNKKVVSPEASFLISSILSDLEARAPTFSSLNVSGRQVAVKTGTTDNNRDAWTIGYTPSVAVGVWVGNNANQPMSGVAGASGAGPIWKNSISNFLTGVKAEPFTPPGGVERVYVCSANSLRADGPAQGASAEYFIKGTAPTQPCNPPKVEEDKKENNENRDNEENKDDNNRKKEEKDEEAIPPVNLPTDEGNGGEGGRGGGDDDGQPQPAPAPPPSSPQTPDNDRRGRDP